MRTRKTKLQANIRKWPCGEAEGKPEGLLEVRANGDRDDLTAKKFTKPTEEKEKGKKIATIHLLEILM